VNVDLNSLIDAAARDKNRFAVNVPRAVSSVSQGRWSQAGASSTWTYRGRVATAISLSFHAVRLALPPSAVLTVSGASTSTRYRARDISRGGLWGRPTVGDTLTLSITVKTQEASQVTLQIDSLQAGYRSLGGGIADHPHYRQLVAAQNLPATDCTENYSCNATAANQGPAQATVAVLVGNQFQCTGTLLNNTSGDGTPYVLTARHCETGDLGGGAPNAAAAVTIYWDAVTACGGTLGSLYSGNPLTQGGATTVVEQQDAWLIKLDSFPVAGDAYYAGWDATGNAFTGGYSIHQALGDDKQYVAWYGQASLDPISASTLKLGYNSTFWGVVNQLGNVGAGASGGALFDPNNHVVGSATLAVLTDGENTAGVCPATPPLAPPSAASVTALYTTLSGVWTSTADTTSTTSSTTLQSVLDPADTGAMVLPGLTPIPVNLTTTQPSTGTGDTVTLSWNLAGGQVCTASGGVAGDGWSGSQAASGSISLTEYVGGTVEYFLSCTTSAGQRAYGGVSVFWDYSAPTLGLVGLGGPLMAGSTGGTFFWDSTVSPCTGSGGLPGDGWAGSQPALGNQAVLANFVGTNTYTLTCGARQGVTTGQVVTYIVAPGVSLTADYTLLAVGSHVTLTASASAGGGSCVKTGGSSTDAWATVPGMTLSGGSSDLVTETTAGTYTYTKTCTGGGSSASSSVTVVFTNDTPAATLTASAPQQQVYSTYPSDPVLDLIWTANVSGCWLGATAPDGSNKLIFAPGEFPPGAAADVETTPGSYVYTLSCGNTVQATATIDWVGSLPAPVLTSSANTWVANAPYTLSWQSAAAPCTASGGVAGDGWAGSKSATGSQTVTESTQGAYTFILTCGSGSALSQSQVVALIPPPSIYIQGGGPINTNSATTLWRATLAPCTFLDTSTGPGAIPVAVPPVGSSTSTPRASGTYAYSVTCGSGSQAITSWTQATITVPPPTTLTAGAATALVNTPVTLTWSSSGQNLCYASGGSGLDNWHGTLNASGTATVTSTVATTITYEISCGSNLQSVQVSYTGVAASSPAAATPAVSLSANATTQVEGRAVTLTWSAQNASDCAATGGSSGDGWSGTLATSGTMSVTETIAGQMTYGITCIGAPPAATAQTNVTYTTSSSGSGSGDGSSSSGHGGGGAFDTRWLLLLAIALATRLLQGCAPRAPPGTSRQ
jgi:hypothetical protein